MAAVGCFLWLGDGKKQLWVRANVFCIVRLNNQYNPLPEKWIHSPPPNKKQDHNGQVQTKTHPKENKHDHSGQCKRHCPVPGKMWPRRPMQTIIDCAMVGNGWFDTRSDYRKRCARLLQSAWSRSPFRQICAATIVGPTHGGICSRASQSIQFGMQSPITQHKWYHP